MRASEPVRLVVFLTAGVSLRNWRDWGILERELALYRELHRAGVATCFVSYGGSEDARILRKQAPELRVAFNRFGLRRHVYARLLPWLHHRVLRRASVIKCNQADGGEVALRAARLHRKPFVARTGFGWATTLEKKLPADAWETGYARRVEADLAAGCTRWIVTTDSLARALQEAHPGLGRRVVVVPNFVDTALFNPATDAPDIDLIWIGRLEDEKRPALFLEAAARLAGRPRIAVIGHGAGAEALRRQAEQAGLDVRWTGNLPTRDVAIWLRRAAICVSTSRYEGHPKSVIEAMACGLAVLVVDTPGLRDAVAPDRTGLRCDDTPDALAAAMRFLLDSPADRRRLGAAAAADAAARFSLTHIAAQEAAVLREAAAIPAAPSTSKPHDRSLRNP